ncbi:SRPBCC domain-containing protein [Cellulomonas sp. McL0617]|uniref:SRPBCC domain-containing protein n=1 Tax=Cellulomonas sp. McL0617 TaxID=3415675 RepID=UPI003CF818B1
MDTSPIRHELVLPVTPREAFDAYVQDIAQWWDPAYSPSADDYRGMTIEPRVGGRVFIDDAARGEVVWGHVLAIAAGAIVVHTLAIGPDVDHPSRISAQFVPLDEGGTRFEFEHGGWTPENAAERARFRDWPRILDRYASFVASRPKP